MHFVEEVDEVTILVDGVDVPGVGRVGNVNFEADCF
jgi:hypothetical protein